MAQRRNTSKKKSSTASGAKKNSTSSGAKKSGTSTAARSSAARGRSSAAPSKETKRTAAKKKSFLKKELISIALVAAGCFLILAEIGLMGSAGSALRNLQMGLFGQASIIFGITLLAMAVTAYLERGHELRNLKLLSEAGLFIAVTTVAQLLFGTGLADTGVSDRTFAALYSLGAEGGSGGGAIGGVIAYTLSGVIGAAGTWLVLIAISLMFAVVITEKSIMAVAGAGAAKTAGAVRYGAARTAEAAGRSRDRYVEERRKRKEEERLLRGAEEAGRGAAENGDSAPENGRNAGWGSLGGTGTAGMAEAGMASGGYGDVNGPAGRHGGTDGGSSGGTGERLSGYSGDSGAAGADRAVAAAEDTAADASARGAYGYSQGGSGANTLGTAASEQGSGDPSCDGVSRYAREVIGAMPANSRGQLSGAGSAAPDAYSKGAYGPGAFADPGEGGRGQAAGGYGSSTVGTGDPALYSRSEVYGISAGGTAAGAAGTGSGVQSAGEIDYDVDTVPFEESRDERYKSYSNISGSFNIGSGYAAGYAVGRTGYTDTGTGTRNERPVPSFSTFRRMAGTAFSGAGIAADTEDTGTLVMPGSEESMDADTKESGRILLYDDLRPTVTGADGYTLTEDSQETGDGVSRVTLPSGRETRGKGTQTSETPGYGGEIDSQGTGARAAETTGYGEGNWSRGKGNQAAEIAGCVEENDFRGTGARAAETTAYGEGNWSLSKGTQAVETTGYGEESQLRSTYVQREETEGREGKNRFGNAYMQAEEPGKREEELSPDISIKQDEDLRNGMDTAAQYMDVPVHYDSTYGETSYGEDVHEGQDEEYVTVYRDTYDDIDDDEEQVILPGSRGYSTAKSAEGPEVSMPEWTDDDSHMYGGYEDADTDDGPEYEQDVPDASDGSGNAGVPDINAAGKRAWNRSEDTAGGRATASGAGGAVQVQRVTVPGGMVSKEAAGRQTAAGSGQGAQPAPSEKQDGQDNTPGQRKPYVFPDPELLERGSALTTDTREEAMKNAAKLEQVLRDFGVGVTVTNVIRGPRVSRYEILPDTGVKVSRITSLSGDIKLALAAAEMRIEAPIPGKSAVGIEIPNRESHTVRFRDILESEEFRRAGSKLSWGIGLDIQGSPVIADIAKMPHVLVAGTTGSGKSVGINSLIMSILYKSTPEEVRMILIDPKVVELSVYNGIPHLLTEVVTKPDRALTALNWAVAEMNNRYRLFQQSATRNIAGYNKKIEQVNSRLPEDTPEEERAKKLPYILIVIDELSELMLHAKKDVETAIVSITQLARAAGIHLVVATQRPSVDVITGLIKSNIPSRIAYRLPSATDSRTILDSGGAETLLGNGDMLYKPGDRNSPARVQGAFLTDAEVESVVDFLRKENEPGDDGHALDDAMNTQMELDLGGGRQDGRSQGPERDDYFEDAGRLIINTKKASIGALQRKFKIGFNRAARIMDQLCEAGVVSESEGTRERQILMDIAEFDELIRG